MTEQIGIDASGTGPGTGPRPNNQSVSPAPWMDLAVVHQHGPVAPQHQAAWNRLLGLEQEALRSAAHRRRL